MNNQFKEPVILVSIILVIFFIVSLLAKHEVTDIQLHDTYFVIHWPEAIISISGPIIILIYFFRALSKDFAHAGINVCLILGLLFVSYPTLLLLLSLDYKSGKALGFLLLCLACILILIIRTIKTWNDGISKHKK
jgi:hypothetical protein